jgi:hypothetical protein
VTWCILPERIVLPYEPKQIYLSAGGNDLHLGRTPEDVLASFKAFVTMLREKTAENQAQLPFHSAVARALG